MHIFGGLLFIVWGFCIYFNPVYYSTKHGITHDFTGIEGYVLVIFVSHGTILIWLDIRKK